ncbi:MAG: Cell division protein FtsL [Calditrichaeota bacterium]|nr:Cell division protein FtsL [Calditrichota bacterium]
MKPGAYSEPAVIWGSHARGRVYPVRTRGLALPFVLFAALLLVFGFVMMHLQVQKSHYGRLITRENTRVEQLRSEVRELNGRLAAITALPSIRSRAREMGMIEPDRPPQDLVVTFDADELARMGGRESETVAGMFARDWSGADRLVPPGEGDDE